MKHKFLVNLVVGDWSNDGHGISETITVNCNIDKDAIMAAYKAGSEKTGVDLVDGVCIDYEDNAIRKRDWDKLAAHGITLEQVLGEFKGSIKDAKKALARDEGFALYGKAFAMIYMLMAKLGDPTLEYEVSEDDSPNINIGGYGLFE